MCKFTSSNRNTLLGLMPEILNLNCYMNDSARWPTFSAYNAQIRNLAALLTAYLAHEGDATSCNSLWLNLNTEMFLFY